MTGKNMERIFGRFQLLQLHKELTASNQNCTEPLSLSPWVRTSCLNFLHGSPRDQCSIYNAEETRLRRLMGQSMSLHSSLTRPFSEIHSLGNPRNHFCRELCLQGRNLQVSSFQYAWSLKWNSQYLSDRQS
ncbi:hypothetical protein V3C99_018277 [Haemonchus contortus]